MTYLLFVNLVKFGYYRISIMLTFSNLHCKLWIETRENFCCIYWTDFFSIYKLMLQANCLCNGLGCRWDYSWVYWG
jgi:hypothetical protein